MPIEIIMVGCFINHHGPIVTATRMAQSGSQGWPPPPCSTVGHSSNRNNRNQHGGAGETELGEEGGGGSTKFSHQTIVAVSVSQN